MINYSLLQPQASPIKTQVVATPPSGGDGGDDLFGGLKGLLGGLKSAFGDNPVSQANQAVTQTMATGQSNPISQAILPQSMQSRPQGQPGQNQQQNQQQSQNQQQPIRPTLPNSLSSNPMSSSNPMTTLPMSQNLGQNPSQNPSTQGLSTPRFMGANANATSDPRFMGSNSNVMGNTSLNQHGILNQTMQSIAGVETGGSKNPYGELGPATRSGDRAYGKYQIMGSNIPSWSKEALGRSVTPHEFLNNPQIQDAVASHRMGNYLQKYSPQDTASMWFSGKPMNKAGNVRDSFGTTVPQYINKFNQGFNAHSNSPVSNGGIQRATQASASNDPMKVAQQYLGYDEKTQSKTLSQFFNKSGMGNVNPQTTPWCAAYANSVIQASGGTGTGSLAAKSFLNWGSPTNKPTRGDVVVYNSMSGGGPEHGHVGFFDSYVTKGDQQYVRTLGGNQDGKVEYKDYPASKVAGFRTPPTAGEIQHKATMMNPNEPNAKTTLNDFYEPIVPKGWMPKNQGPQLPPNQNPAPSTAAAGTNPQSAQPLLSGPNSNFKPYYDITKNPLLG